MYAVIETGSKQYRVEVGTELQVELLDVEPGETITLDRVLLVADGDSAAIGQPTVDGATVSAEVLRRDRGEKLIAFKYRPKARRRVKKGHRQELTVLRVADIVFGGKSAAETVKKAQAAAKTERQRLEEAAARQAAEDAALAAKLAKAAEPKTADGTDAASRKAGKPGKPGARAGKATDDAGDGKGTKAAGSARRGSTGTSTGEPKTPSKATRTGGRTTDKKDGPSGPAPRRGSRPKKDG
jgi:large subunit ribosomal protein L21